MIDYKHFILPDNITLPLLWTGLIMNTVWNVFQSAPNAILGAAVGYLSLWSVYWLFKLCTDKEGMGFGDFKLLALLGAWFGWQAIPGILFLSSFIGSVIGLGLILCCGKNKNTPLPFGPYLAIGGYTYLLWGQTLTDYYLHQLRISFIF